MKIEKHSRFLLIGDSITDTNRDPSGQPTPWNPAIGLGRGYVNFLNALIENKHPGHAIRVINRGVSGNTIRDLRARWHEDVISLSPDWLSIFIGINDVWRHFDTPLNIERQVPLEAYTQIYEELLSHAQQSLSLQGLILISPYVVEKNPEDPFRKKMAQYGEVVAQLASENNAIHIDSQSAIDRLLEHHHPTELAWDRIHLNPTGHMALALAILDKLTD